MHQSLFSFGQYLQGRSALFSLTLCWLCISTATAQRDQAFRPQLLAISVDSLEVSIDWYSTVLGFELETDIREFPDYGMRLAFVRKGNFHLELIQIDGSFQPADLLPNSDAYLGGFYKVGFRLADIRKFYNQLESTGVVSFVTDVQDLPGNKLPIPWPTRHFLVTDPDGNYVQFFDGGGQTTIPWLVMITVKSLERTIAWYVEKLGFRHIETVGPDGNRRAILEREGTILEMFEPAEVQIVKDLEEGINARGFAKLAFTSSNVEQEATNFREMGVDIFLGPQAVDDFDWATKAMIVKDPEGNWVQFFEVQP